MTKYRELKSQADNFRKSKDYSSALPIYKEIWENHENENNEWDGWGFAYCLKNLKYYIDALNICRNVYRKYPDFPQIKSVYAWCIYYTEISIDVVHDENRYFKAAKAILQLSSQIDMYSPYTITVFKVLDYLKNKNIYPSEKILEWTDCLNPNDLEIDPPKYNNADGKIIENASQKEKYYSFRTKALEKSKRFQECIDLCYEALNSLEIFHSDNDTWFTLRITKSRLALGQSENCVNELKELLKKKKEWFIQKEISELLFNQNDINQALKYAIDGALNAGDLDKKMNLFLLLESILYKMGRFDEAKKHIELIYIIRSTNNWKIEQNIQELMNKYKIEPKDINTDIKTFAFGLKQIWEKLKFSEMEQLSGVIHSILPNGKSGFIESDNHKRYYFQFRDFKEKKEILKEGLQVTYYLDEGFDIKRNQKSLNAVFIKISNKADY